MKVRINPDKPFTPIMITLIRTTSDHLDFIMLVKQLDSDLKIRDGDDHPFYDQFNKIDNIKHVILACLDNEPVGCGAIKAFGDCMEIKRMFVLPQYRSMGIASQILAELESWTSELLFKKCVLETGKLQPEAIALYLKNGYQIIGNYGPYKGVENSVCFEKRLN